MKSVGVTFFVSALALIAGCSSGNSASPPVEDAATSTESLTAPRPGPENDPCARVRCAAGTECVVVDGAARCQETDVNPCAAVSCLVGTTCEVVDGEPVCTPIEPSGPFCGGFAGIQCAGAGMCVDDPTDSCDPDNGGADCGGLCECNVLELCIEGFSFDPSPEVCACVESPETDPCAAVRCAEGTECVVIDDRASCEPTVHPCALVLCPPDTTCEVVDDRASCEPTVHPCALVLCPPDTTCEVVDGDAECRGIEPPSGPFCGGFAGIECPGAGTCVDDPTDSCDPDDGGADCGGVCECNALQLCIQGFSFDPSPEVCACVESPETDPCAAVRCGEGTACIVVDGMARCESPCVLVDCFPDQVCRVIEGEAVCVPAEGQDCE
jgi:hypothetical protein